MLIFYITFLNKHLRSFQQKIFIYALGPLSSSSVWSDAVAICKCASTILTTIIVTWILLADTLKAKTQVMIGVLKKFLLWSNQSWPQFGCPVWLAQNISPSFCHQWPVFLQKLSRSLCCLLKLDWNDPHQCIPFVVRRQSYWQKSIKKETLQFASVYKTTSLALKRATQWSRKYVFAMKIKISIFDRIPRIA